MKQKKLQQNFKPESLMMSAGYNPFESDYAAKPPIYLSSTFIFPNAEAGEAAFKAAYGLGKLKKGAKTFDIYSRLNNPNLQIAEGRLTIYEKGAEECAIFASGL